MMRVVVAFVTISFAALLVGIWVLAPPAPLTARFGADDCRRIALTDGVAADMIRGAEDIALLPNGDSLIVSAHDRRTGAMANGGLYRVSLFAMDGSDQMSATALYIPDGNAYFRPHGISVSADGNRLAVINRFAPAQARVEIGALAQQGWSPSHQITGAELCRANDLELLAADHLRVSIDRADCDTSMRDLSPGSTTGRVLTYRGGALETWADGLSFANGLHGDVVAETRANRLSRKNGDSITLPGGPDNLSRDETGALIVAVHPVLLQLGLYLRGWLDRAPSRIVRVEPDTDQIEVLFDDPSGALFAGATSAILSRGRLVVGSAGDAGLLYCRKVDA